MEFYDFPETVGNFIIPMAMWWLTITYYNYNWLVVWNMTFIFPNNWDDDPIWRTHIFQRGRYTTNQWKMFRETHIISYLCQIYGCWCLSCTWSQGTAVTLGIGRLCPWRLRLSYSWEEIFSPLISNPAINHGSVEDLYTSETVLGGCLMLGAGITRYWTIEMQQILQTQWPQQSIYCNILYHLHSNKLCDHVQRWLGPKASTASSVESLVIGSTGLVSCEASLFSNWTVTKTVTQSIYSLVI